MSVASVLASLSGLPLPQAAARLAAAGVPVFPCVPGEKRPLTRHGFHEASVDLAQVVAWWHRWPSANIGVPTGTASGVDVVDVDRKPDGNGFDAFGRARRAGLVEGWVAVVRTPSGGAHFYYPADPGRSQPSWQAAAARVDFRGTGGYVIVPPSAVMTVHGPAVTMMNENDSDAPDLGDEPDLDEAPEEFEGSLLPEPPHPINWNLLTSEEAEAEWLELNKWVNWLRTTYGLPASVVPPFWHRHPELVWELSALHLHWLAAYDSEQNASAPLGWHRDFADARQRLRDWVAACGTRLDRDRPTRQTVWPGEDPAEPVEDRIIANRDEDFVQFVLDDVAARKQAEDEFYAGLDPATGELRD